MLDRLGILVSKDCFISSLLESGGIIGGEFTEIGRGCPVIEPGLLLISAGAYRGRMFSATGISGVGGLRIAESSLAGSLS